MRAKTKAVAGRGRASRSTLKRRWFRFGPGLLLAIVASVIVWQWMPPGFLPKSLAPRLEKSQIEEFPAARPSAPEPAWLLSQRWELGLSETQVQKLEQLRIRWKRDTGQLRGELVRASHEFNRSMSDNGGRLTMQQLQERAAPVSEISRQLADARRAWWAEAATTLTASQRQRAEAAWARRFSAPPNHEKNND